MSDEEALRDIKLPCDVPVGATVFRKGVSVWTLVQAVRRYEQRAEDAEAFERELNRKLGAAEAALRDQAQTSN